MIQRRPQIKNAEMKMISVNKAQFTGLNYKRYYFSDGVVSFPYGLFHITFINFYHIPYFLYHITIFRSEKERIQGKTSQNC